MHAAFEPVRERPLSSTACVDLRFDYKTGIAQFTRDCFSFIGRRSNFSARGGDAEFLQQLLGLILMNIHCALASKALKCANGNRNSVRMAAHDETAAKIDKALANKQLLQSAAKNIRGLLAGAPSGLYARVIEELVARGNWD